MICLIAGQVNQQSSWRLARYTSEDVSTTDAQHDLQKHDCGTGRQAGNWMPTPVQRHNAPYALPLHVC